MGFVTKIQVQVGDKVRKGQLLLSINNTDLQAKAAQVNAISPKLLLRTKMPKKIISVSKTYLLKTVHLRKSLTI
jgi:multidrug efflux pump subunit AcrA (membrane-fusion protein)